MGQGNVMELELCGRSAAEAAAGASVTSRRLRLLEPSLHTTVSGLLEIAVDGLARGYRPELGQFGQTVRCVSTGDGLRLQVEGTSVRYTAMAAMGLSRLPLSRQRTVLGGSTAGEIVSAAAGRSLADGEPGAIALVAWAEAEVNGTFSEALFDRLRCMLRDHSTPLTTVSASWLVTAAVAASGLGDTDDLVAAGARILMATEGTHGIRPHWARGDRSRWRGHVGSFADQVYPIQALARASLLATEPDWLDAADRTAHRICALQGSAGQWWWHYDSRGGGLVESFPVYSVHQHAMAPMVLLDLVEAGGGDHTTSVARGVDWLRRHPETVEELVSHRWRLVWRKVGRREPSKAARGLHAVTTSLRPGARVPGLDRILPPGSVDHECRPYELGWMLYAWLGGDEDA